MTDPHQVFGQTGGEAKPGWEQVFDLLNDVRRENARQMSDLRVDISRDLEKLGVRMEGVETRMQSQGTNLLLHVQSGDHVKPSEWKEYALKTEQVRTTIKVAVAITMAFVTTATTILALIINATKGG